MRKAIFIMVVPCLFARFVIGATDGGSDPNRSSVKVQGDRTLTIKGEWQDDKWFPVDVKTTVWVVISTVCGVGAVGGAWWAAHKTRIAAEGRLFFELMSEYARKEMRDDVRILCEWGREDGENLEGNQLKGKAQKWVESLNSGDSDADDIDLARRHVTYFFDSLSRLMELKYIDGDLAKGVCEGMSPRVIDIILVLGETLIRDIGAGEKHEDTKITKRVERLRGKLGIIKKLIDDCPDK